MALGSHGFLRCSACDEHKPPDDFYRSNTEKRGRQYQCIECVKARKREKASYRRLPPGDYVKAQYMVTREQRDALRALAKEHGVTMSAIVNTAIERTLRASDAP